MNFEDRVSWAGKIQALIDRGADVDQIMAMTQEAINFMSDQLGIVARSVHPADYPMLAACMELSCERLRSEFPPEINQAVDTMKSQMVHIVGVSFGPEGGDQE